MSLASVIVTVIASLWFSAAYAGKKVGDIRVHSAFVHVPSGMLVIVVEQYQPDPEHQGTFSWLDYRGLGGLYWGNTARGFDKLAESTQYPNHWRGQNSDRIAILAPSADHPDRRVILQFVHQRSRNRSSTPPPLPHLLEVHCANTTTCMLAKPEVAARVNRAVIKEPSLLRPLPDVRELKFLLRSAFGDKYVAIETNKLDPVFESLQVMFLQNGEVIFTDMKDFRHARNSASIYIVLKDGLMLLVRGPKTGEKTTLYDADGQTIAEFDIVPPDEITPGLLERIGLPPMRYKTPLLRTPCEALFGM